MASRELPFISTHPSHTIYYSSLPVCCNCLLIHGEDSSNQVGLATASQALSWHSLPPLCIHALQGNQPLSSAQDPAPPSFSETWLLQCLLSAVLSTWEHSTMGGGEPHCLPPSHPADTGPQSVPFKAKLLQLLPRPLAPAPASIELSSLSLHCDCFRQGLP